MALWLLGILLEKLGQRWLWDFVPWCPPAWQLFTSHALLTDACDDSLSVPDSRFMAIFLAFALEEKYGTGAQKAQEVVLAIGSTSSQSKYLPFKCVVSDW